jgi:outer membrane protein assembly factor BamC
MRLRWVVCAGVLLLGGCSGLNDWLEGKDRTPYKSGATLPPLEVPPDLTAPGRDDRFAVPDNGTTTATLSGYEAGRRGAKPAPSGVLPQYEHMRIERDGGERWLVIDRPPEQLWPLVRQFWQENGFLIKTDLPQVGVMETEWAESHPRVPDGVIRGVLSRALGTFYSSGVRDKYRTRLERSPDGKSTEVYISHYGMEEVYTSREPSTAQGTDTRWQPRAPDPGLEAEFLRKLMVSLGASPEQAAQLAKAPDTESQRARIRKGATGEALEVDEPFDRTWRRVGLALDRVGFTVEDRDRQKGLYFVRYADPESTTDKRGFFARMFSTSRQLTPEQYRVQVVDSGKTSQVNVLNKDGAADSSATAQRILALLQEQLK